jgi:hypothetical protein
MGQSIHCISNSYAGCALSVQKIYFYLTEKKLILLKTPPGLYFSTIR